MHGSNMPSYSVTYALPASVCLSGHHWQWMQKMNESGQKTIWWQNNNNKILGKNSPLKGLLKDDFTSLVCNTSTSINNHSLQ